MKSRKKGFTLMELVVVIAILAVLGALLYPQLTKYMDNAKKEVAHRNLVTVYNHFTAQLELEKLEPTWPNDTKIYLIHNNERLDPSVQLVDQVLTKAFEETLHVDYVYYISVTETDDGLSGSIIIWPDAKDDKKGYTGDRYELKINGNEMEFIDPK